MRCPRCGLELPPSPFLFRCPRCGELLDAVLIVEKLNDKMNGLFSGKGVWRYKKLLPDVDEPVTMGEGGTPLIKLNRYGNVYAKFEGANPTGSFKDRGMTVGVSMARALGFKGVIVASTGNTAASAAAYSARARLECIVVLPRGNVAKGKLSQAVLHGAKILEVAGSFDDALEYVMEGVINNADNNSIRYYPLNSINPWRLEGQKTAAFEIFEEVGVPDFIIVPVGNGGNIYAIWKGFEELRLVGLIDRVPRMVGVQASGAAPLVRYWRGLGEPRINNPSTVATAIRIGKPVNWFRAYRAVKNSGGIFIDVSDEEILNAQRELGRMGVGVEPASAASLAGYKKLLNEGFINRGDKVVLIATGHALKDPDIIIKDLRTTSVNGFEEFLKILRE